MLKILIYTGIICLAILLTNIESISFNGLCENYGASWNSWVCQKTINKIKNFKTIARIEKKSDYPEEKITEKQKNNWNTIESKDKKCWFKNGVDDEVCQKK